MEVVLLRVSPDPRIGIIAPPEVRIVRTEIVHATLAVPGRTMTAALYEDEMRERSARRFVRREFAV